MRKIEEKIADGLMAELSVDRARAEEITGAVVRVLGQLNIRKDQLEDLAFHDHIVCGGWCGYED